MQIRAMREGDLSGVIHVWNACVEAGEVLYYPLTEDYFRRKFVEGEGCEPDNLLVAADGDRVIGFIHGVAPGAFRLARPGQAYLTCVFVDPARRGEGAGRALLQALKAAMKARGATALSVSSLNPVNLDWRIPGTPGHDHNNMPGLDNGCAGFGFFGHSGFSRRHDEVSMYINLADYRAPEGLDALRARLSDEGIYTGPYDASLRCDFDGMCDRVGSDYWRDVLRTETEAHLLNQPNADARMWADGIRPAGPRTILAAVHEGHIVGFTGPVDKQKSGRGWFTGICTDPEFGRRGIATVLFNSLLDAFVREGAAFTSLFTGEDNPAKKIYLGAGMREARRFALMALPLGGSHE